LYLIFNCQDREIAIVPAIKLDFTSFRIYLPALAGCLQLFLSQTQTICHQRKILTNKKKNRAKGNVESFVF